MQSCSIVVILEPETKGTDTTMTTPPTPNISELRRRIAERKGGTEKIVSRKVGRFSIPNIRIPLLIQKMIVLFRNDIDYLKNRRNNRNRTLMLLKEERDDFIQHHFPNTAEDTYTR
jgi:hypothetical protein